MKNPSSVVIGFDSLCWEYINPLLRQGRLPNLYYLMKNGFSGILQSTQPPLSPVAWSTFITGKNPGKHLIFDWFLRENDKDIRPVNSRDRKGKPFWYYLNEAGLRVGISHIPLTYPPDKVDGFFVPGFDTPANASIKTHPPELYDEIEKKYGKYCIQSPPASLIREIGIDKFFDISIQKYRAQMDMSISLARKFETDIIITNLMLNDRFNHIINDYRYIEKGIEIIDKFCGVLLKEFPESNLIILSDHGSCRSKKSFLVNAWLQKMGFILLDRNSLKLQAFKYYIEIVFQKYIKNRILEKIIRNIILKSNNYLRFDHLLPLRFDGFYFNPIIPGIKNNSKTLFCSPSACAFYLNKNSAQKDKFIEMLLSIKDQESGEQIFTKAYGSETLYEKCFYHAPDIIAEYNHNFPPSNKLPVSLSINNFVVTCNEVEFYGTHTKEGIFIFYGKVFKRGSSLKLQLADIPALILYLNGVSIPKDFDGNVPLSVIKDSFFKQNPLKYQDVTKDGKQEDKKFLNEDMMVRKKLAELGYL